jgi:DNA-binding NarL/FixJ family response regulator
VYSALDIGCLIASLSPRELEVAALASKGCTAREIGQHLHLSPRTVETHVARIYSKLGINSRVELALVMLRGAG